jgi:hypothetical protein
VWKEKAPTDVEPWAEEMQDRRQALHRCVVQCTTMERTLLAFMPLRGRSLALLGLLRRSPTEFGIESRFWTGADLAAVAHHQGIAPAMSARTARREIRRAGYRWQQAKWWSAKEPEYERKKAARALGRTRASGSGMGPGV